MDPLLRPPSHLRTCPWGPMSQPRKYLVELCLRDLHPWVCPRLTRMQDRQGCKSDQPRLGRMRWGPPGA